MVERLKKSYETILLLTILLTVFGVIMVFSSSIVMNLSAKELSTSLAIGQAIKALIGVVGMFVLARFLDYKKLMNYRSLFVIVSIILLFLVLFIGKKINGGHRWLAIPHLLAFQPSEVAKFSLIIYSAAYISKNIERLKKSIKGMIPLFVVISIMFLLVLVEPDMSSGALLAFIPSLLLVIASDSFKIRHALLSLIVVAIIFIIGISLQPYRLHRIKNFYYADSKSANHAVNYQQKEALAAIANGGIARFNIGGSHQKVILPEAYNDFIFAIICEELGFVGAVALILIYLFYIITGFKTAKMIENRLGRYLILGMFINFSVFAIVHMFVSLRIIPTTGITLPFISFGGTSLIFNLLAVGTVLAVVKREIYELKG